MSDELNSNTLNAHTASPSSDRTPVNGGIPNGRVTPDHTAVITAPEKTVISSSSLDGSGVFTATLGNGVLVRSNPNGTTTATTAATVTSTATTSQTNTPKNHPTSKFGETGNPLDSLLVLGGIVLAAAALSTSGI